MSSSSGEERSEIAFFDVETTVPTRPGQRFALLEFGAILVCPKKLVELQSYSTLIKPADHSLISTLSVRCNGITPDAVVSAPTFLQIADRVYDLLHGRIWAGHNILRFDCARIREAFAEIGKPTPEPKGTIDSLQLLTQKFGRRAGDMKMATLATYFGLGQQTHRSLDDVRMNLEVVKYCATVLFLESSLPDIFTANSWVSPNAMTRSRSNVKSTPEGVSLKINTPPSSSKLNDDPMLSPTNQEPEEKHPILSLLTRITAEEVEPNTAQWDPFDMGQLSNEMEESYEMSSTESSAAAVSDGSSDSAGFLEPDELSCSRLKVRFGISTKFLDHAGRPRLNFVANAPESLCKVLDACDGIAQNLSLDSGSNSEWRPAVIRKNGFVNYPTVRLHIPNTISGDNPYGTEMYQKDSGSIQKLVFSKYDPAELDPLFTPGTFVDAFFSIDPYDYQQNAGIRLVAKKLIIHFN
uniref:Exonuclease domain-containing protein n=1 Tax=Quercus lobata TaxID=97700 RepID=A0A7N2N7A7_QUELO